MGNTAIVAFENSDDTFDLHRSPDGATNLQLLFPLSLAATSDNPQYRDFVASLDAPESLPDTPGGRDYLHAIERRKRGLSTLADSDPTTLLEEDPYETGVPPESLMEHVPPGTVNLYVVRDDLSLYYPAWGSIGLVPWMADTVRVEAYDRDRVPSPGQVDALVARDPDFTYEGEDEFAALAHPTPEEERYDVFKNHFQAVGANLVQDSFHWDNAGESLSGVRVIAGEWVFVVKPIDEHSITPPEQVSRAQYPIQIPLDEGKDIEQVSEDLSTVQDMVAETALYIDAMLLATEVPIHSEKVFANSGEMFLEQIEENYGSRVATTFLPFDL